MEHNKFAIGAKPPPNGTRMKVSFRQGIECWFDVDEFTIRVWVSAWSGRETITIEDRNGARVVSDKRSLRFLTPHDFELGGQAYRVTVHIKKLGVAEISLYRDGVLIDSDLLDNRGLHINPETGRVDWARTWKRLLPAVLAGLISGAAAGYFFASLFN